MWSSLKTCLSLQMITRDLRNIHITRNSFREKIPCVTWHQNYPGTFTCWWRNLLVLTSKFGLLILRLHSATRKHLFVSSRWQVMTIIIFMEWLTNKRHYFQLGPLPEILIITDLWHATTRVWTWAEPKINFLLLLLLSLLIFATNIFTPQ